MKTFIKNATIVNEGLKFKGHVLISGETIEKIFPHAIPGDLDTTQMEVIDAEGLMLIPGVIDDQVHFREPGLTHKGEIATESRAAVAGGVTTYMEMPNTNPQTDYPGRTAKKIRPCRAGIGSQLFVLYGGYQQLTSTKY